MRLFIAVSADESVKAAASEAVARLKRAGGDYRWVDPRDMHTTLRFIGETPEARLPEILALMSRAAARTAPFEIVYGGLGAFESLEDPRVAWISLSAGVEKLKALARLLGREEPRPFLPHLTLGRRRREPTPPSFTRALREAPVLGLRCLVEKIALYVSRPAPFGHAYEILEEIPLSASTTA